MHCLNGCSVAYLATKDTVEILISLQGKGNLLFNHLPLKEGPQIESALHSVAEVSTKHN